MNRERRNSSTHPDDSGFDGVRRWSCHDDAPDEAAQDVLLVGRRQAPAYPQCGKILPNILQVFFHFSREWRRLEAARPCVPSPLALRRLLAARLPSFVPVRLPRADWLDQLLDSVVERAQLHTLPGPPGLHAALPLDRRLLVDLSGLLPGD